MMKALFFVLNLLKRFMQHIHKLFSRKKIKVTVQDVKTRKVTIEMRNLSQEEFQKLMEQWSKLKTLDQQEAFSKEHDLEIEFIEAKAVEIKEKGEVKKDVITESTK